MLLIVARPDFSSLAKAEAVNVLNSCALYNAVTNVAAVSIVQSLDKRRKCLVGMLMKSGPRIACALAQLPCSLRRCKGPDKQMHGPTMTSPLSTSCFALQT